VARSFCRQEPVEAAGKGGCQGADAADVNEADKQKETPVVEAPLIIEEAIEEIEPTNEVVEETPTIEEAKEELKPKAKPKPTDKVDCNTCGKTLS